MSTVFSYLVDPTKLVQWMGVSAQIDPRPGGEFRVDVDGEHVAIGQYKLVEPPRRIVFSWGWEGDAEVAPGSTTVEITLTPDGSDTLLRLRHSDLPNEQQQAIHQEGWRMYTARLAELKA